jgi:flagellar hook-basal body complex protein FliE
MAIDALSAAKAYANVQKAAASLGGGDTAPVQGGGGFADILKSAMTDAVKASRNAETQMVNQVQGKAELVDVATAISAAETSLETVMAVRDQVISAYQEIMRMPI